MWFRGRFFVWHIQGVGFDPQHRERNKNPHLYWSIICIQLILSKHIIEFREMCIVVELLLQSYKICNPPPNFFLWSHFLLPLWYLAYPELFFITIVLPNKVTTVYIMESCSFIVLTLALFSIVLLRFLLSGGSLAHLFLLLGSLPLYGCTILFIHSPVDKYLSHFHFKFKEC